MDPKSNVALRTKAGGPAPAETQRMRQERQNQIAAGQQRLAQRRSQVEMAIAELGREMAAKKESGLEGMLLRELPRAS